MVPSSTASLRMLARVFGDFTTASRSAVTIASSMVTVPPSQSMSDQRSAATSPRRVPLAAMSRTHTP